MIPATGLSRAALTEKPYRWRGTPGWNPAAGLPGRRRADRAPGPANAAHNRQQQADRDARLARFARLRDEGISVPAAGREIGVGRTTAMRYDQELRARAAGQEG